LDGIALPKVIVVADQGIDDLVSAAETVGASVVQLHGGETPELAAELREGGPCEVWKALRVRSIADVRQGLADFGGRVHGLLLDGWHPDRMGGTGRTFSWREVGEIRSEFPADLDFIAAGGLRPENVREALARLRPQIVDVSSGVEERPGKKDPSRVEAFIQQVRIEAREETG
jgi:phosphoribosylanthranilate isomerase